MAKLSKAHIKTLVGHLLVLKPLVDHYQELEREIKSRLVEADYAEIEVDGRGRVFISKSERVTISPEMARQVLGKMAEGVIEVRESVPSARIAALVESGLISDELHERLLAGAERREVVNLYIRPLN